MLERSHDASEAMNLQAMSARETYTSLQHAWARLTADDRNCQADTTPIPRDDSTPQSVPTSPSNPDFGTSSKAAGRRGSGSSAWKQLQEDAEKVLQDANLS